MKQKIIVSLLVAGGLVAPAAHATNGYFAHGYGVKSQGMGGVGIALPQDAIAAATNPAGMVLVGDRIDFGLEWFKPSRSATITGNGAGRNGVYDGNSTSDFFIPDFGYNKMINPNMSLGVTVYGNGGMNTDYATNPFGGLFGGTGPAGVNLAQLFIAPTWSQKINDSNSVGVSLNLAYQTFEAKGIQGFAGNSASPANVSNNGKDSSTGYGLHLGWTGQVSPMITLGAMYQSKTKMSKFNKYSGLFAEQGGFDIPATYGIGAAFKASSATTVAVDIQKIQYGSVASISNPLASPGLLGAANGAGFGWQNMTVYKLGVSHKWDDTLTLRAGYNHNNQQIPATQTFFNILAPGVVQDHITLGATWTLADKSEVSLGYMHAFRKTVNGSGSIPGVPYGGGNANITMYQDSLSVSYGW